MRSLLLFLKTSIFGLFPYLLMSFHVPNCYFPTFSSCFCMARPTAPLLRCVHVITFFDFSHSFFTLFPSDKSQKFVSKVFCQIITIFLLHITCFVSYSLTSHTRPTFNLKSQKYVRLFDFSYSYFTFPSVTFVLQSVYTLIIICQFLRNVAISFFH